jgi:hypothetical protein
LDVVVSAWSEKADAFPKELESVDDEDGVEVEVWRTPAAPIFCLNPWLMLLSFHIARFPSEVAVVVEAPFKT